MRYLVILMVGFAFGTTVWWTVAHWGAWWTWLTLGGVGGILAGSFVMWVALNMAYELAIGRDFGW